MDSGRLSFELCEAKIEEHRTQDQVNEPCCACEEAKYEVTFEGLWSEKSHPKDFPTSRWLLHFSDIIGASHSAGYRCVSYNSYILHTGCNISWRLLEAINCVVSFFPPKKMFQKNLSNDLLLYPECGNMEDLLQRVWPRWPNGVLRVSWKVN